MEKNSTAQLSPSFLNTTTYNYRDGFINNQNSEVLKDTVTGLLWIGSDNGLYRFDGKNFKCYKNIPTDSTSLPNNVVSPLAISRTGILYLRSGNYGVCVFNTITEKFSWLKIKNAVDGKTNAVVKELSGENFDSYFHSAFIDSKQNIWLATVWQGIEKYDARTQTLACYHFFTDTLYGKKWGSKAVAMQIAEDRTHQLWIATNDGLVEFNPENQQTTFHDYPIKNESNTIGSIFFDDENNCWVGTWGGGIRKFVAAKKEWQQFNWSKTIGENICTAIGKKSKTEFWVNTLDAGMLVFNTITNTFNQVSEVGANQNLIHSSAGKAFIDNENILWAVNSNGLIKINPKENLFDFTPVAENGKVIRCLRHSLSHILILGLESKTGLAWVDEKNEQHKINVSPNSNDEEYCSLLYEDKVGKIWVGINNQLYNFDLASKQLKPFTVALPSHQLLNDAVYFMQASNGEYWLTNNQFGLIKMNAACTQTEIISDDNFETGGTIQKYIDGICEDKNENIWVTAPFRKGLFYKLRNENKFHSLTPKYSELSNDPAAISLLPNGDIALVAARDGLYILQHPFQQNEKLIHINQLISSISNVIYNYTVDNASSVWLNTSAGVQVFNPTNFTYKMFSEIDGLQKNNNNGSVIYFDSFTNKILLGVQYGFQSWLPSVAPFTVLPSLIIFNKFSVDGVDKSNWVNSQHEIELHYNQIINIDFAAVTHTYNRLLQYSYKLQGLENDWVYSGANSSINYNRLQGGNYKLLLRCSFDGKTWSQPTSISIKVIPPFWETWWFRFLLLVVIASFIYFIVARRIKRIKYEASLINQLTENRLIALKAQMNPHFIFNCLNTIESYVMKNNPDEAAHFIQKFSKLIRGILENSDRNLISLKDEIELTKIYAELEQKRFKNTFDLKIDIAPEVVESNFEVPPLLIQPYVENAILHGLKHKKEKGLLTISAELVAVNKIKITITDNGIGRTASAKINTETRANHRAMATEINLQRLSNSKNISVEIVDGSNLDGGTMVRIILSK